MIIGTTNCSTENSSSESNIALNTCDSMMFSRERCLLLALPLEIRQAIYELFLANLTIHPCSDEYLLQHHYRESDHTSRAFFENVMKCSSRHYQSLLKSGTWSSISSPHYGGKTLDILHLMRTCKRVYLEMEPLLWSRINLAIGLPHFLIFFKRYLTIPLHSRLPAIVPRAQSLQQVTIALPRADILSSWLAHDLRCQRIDPDAYVDEKFEQSILHLTNDCPQLRSVRFIMDASQLEPQMGPHQAVVYLRWDIQLMLRFRDLKEFDILYSGPLVNRGMSAVSSMFRTQLRFCEQILREMVTGTAVSFAGNQDCPRWLIEDSRFEDDTPLLREYCERVARVYSKWWTGLSEGERVVLFQDYTANTALHHEAEEMSMWMLANQI